MGQNFARNWLVPSSRCLSGTYLHSPALNIDKNPYDLSVTSEPSVPPPTSDNSEIFGFPNYLKNVDTQHLRSNLKKKKTFNGLILWKFVHKESDLFENFELENFDI